MATTRIARPDEDWLDEHIRFFRGIGVALIAAAFFWGAVAYGLVRLLR